MNRFIFISVLVALALVILFVLALALDLLGVTGIDAEAFLIILAFITGAVVGVIIRRRRLREIWDRVRKSIRVRGVNTKCYRCSGCGAEWTEYDLFYSDGACLNYGNPDKPCFNEDTLRAI